MKNKGVTLIEILIYTFLVGLTVSLIIGIMSNFLFVRGIYITRGEVSRSIVYLLEDIVREIQHADKILKPAPKTSSSELLLQQNGKSLSFKLKNGTIIKEVDGKSYPLTPRTLRIKSLNFLHLQQSSEAPGSVKIKLDVEYKNPLNLREYTFSTFYETASTQRK